FPVAVEDEVIPVRDLVMHRTAGIAVAERDAAIHAACRLIDNAAFRHWNGELAEMANTIGGRLIAGLFALDFEKACDFTHGFAPQIPPGRRVIQVVVRKQQSSATAHAARRDQSRPAATGAYRPEAQDRRWSGSRRPGTCARSAPVPS